MGFCDYQQVTSIKCPIRIVGADAECPIRIVFCPISIVPLPNFTRIFAADSATCGKARGQASFAPDCKSVGGIKNMMPYERDRKKDTA